MFHFDLLNGRPTAPDIEARGRIAIPGRLGMRQGAEVYVERFVFLQACTPKVWPDNIDVRSFVPRNRDCVKSRRSASGFDSFAGAKLFKEMR